MRSSSPAADPSWWNHASTKVWESNPVNIENRSPATVAQLKHFAAQAEEYLRLTIPAYGGAGLEAIALVDAFDYSGGELPAATFQGKKIAKAFYDHLWAIGYDPRPRLEGTHNVPSSTFAGQTGPYYPWKMASPPAEDLAPLLVGQLKILFSFDVGPVGSFTDTDSDSIPDWWEMRYFMNLTTAGSGTDSDGDGLNDDEELDGGTSPVLADSDGDGVDDLTEQQQGSNPTAVDYYSVSFSADVSGGGGGTPPEMQVVVISEPYDEPNQEFPPSGAVFSATSSGIIHFRKGSNYTVSLSRTGGGPAANYSMSFSPDIGQLDWPLWLVQDSGNPSLSGSLPGSGTVAWDFYSLAARITVDASRNGSLEDELSGDPDDDKYEDSGFANRPGQRFGAVVHANYDRDGGRTHSTVYNAAPAGKQLEIGDAIYFNHDFMGSEEDWTIENAVGDLDDIYEIKLAGLPPNAPSGYKVFLKVPDIEMARAFHLYPARNLNAPGNLGGV